MVELDSSLEPSTPNPHLKMILHLLQSHSEGRIVSPSSLVAAAGVPYATATRKLAEVEAAGLIDRRVRTRTGKSHSLHPSASLLDAFSQLADRIDRLARRPSGWPGRGRKRRITISAGHINRGAPRLRRRAPCRNR